MNTQITTSINGINCTRCGNGEYMCQNGLCMRCDNVLYGMKE